MYNKICMISYDFSMRGVYLLTFLSVAMFGGSYLAGSVPFAFSMSEHRMRLASIFGAGLLVGTALSVIIPEGVESLYNSITGFFLFDHCIISVNSRTIDLNDKMHGHDGNHSVIHKSVGLSLVVGFIFMLLIDQATRIVTSTGGEKSRYKLTATVGLIVHAAADGVALGSVSMASRSNVQFIIFLAIMLHKAPAAFGLVSFLLVEGFERFRVRRHLLAFSLAAPITAIVTFYILLLVGQQSSSLSFTTGILMLFSGGTFLYVATVHILPELLNSNSHSHHQLNQGEIIGNLSVVHSVFTVKELLAIIVGAILPAFLASHHSH
ncbi:unnamed protein product [Dracunculus medinensis]|uniref:Zinc transporter ZIP9 n=1 Tax=Dracunculus medinensis TaxID=318479 RepID=A0A3P7PIS9_DRAME|nr:unnamed protein product [Dracunculus medinensis]